MINSIHSHPKSNFCLSYLQNCILIVSLIAGPVFLTLGLTNIAIGISFTANVVVGSSCFLLAIGTIVWKIFYNSKSALEKTPIETLSSRKNTVTTSSRIAERESETIQMTDQVKIKEASLLQEKYEALRQSFRQSAEQRMKKMPLPAFDLPDCSDASFRKNAEEAFAFFFSRETNLPAHIKVYSGATQVCVTTDKIPGVIFKRWRSGSECFRIDKVKDQVNLTTKAIEICQRNHLNLLCVPQCKAVSFQPSIIMQQKMEITSTGRNFVRSCFSWAITEPQLRPYIKELFRQYLVFICLNGFGDVKYDNMPFAEGLGALIDIDDHSAIIGLTLGCANRKNGLFSMIPFEWFDEFALEAKKLLDEEAVKKLEERLPKLRKKAEKWQQRKVEMATFYRNRNISSPYQPLAFDPSHFAQYSKEVSLFAQKAISHMNLNIATNLNLISMEAGRKITIATNNGDPLFLDLKQYSATFRQICEEGLKALKTQGYIFSYYISPYYPFFSVVC